MKKLIWGVLGALALFAVVVTAVDALTPRSDVWPVMGSGFWVFVRTPGFGGASAVLAGALAYTSAMAAVRESREKREEERMARDVEWHREDRRRAEDLEERADGRFWEMYRALADKVDAGSTSSPSFILALAPLARNPKQQESVLELLKHFDMQDGPVTIRQGGREETTQPGQTEPGTRRWPSLKRRRPQARG